MNDQYPNRGTLWYQDAKENEKAPDFKGAVSIDKYFLLDLIENSSSGVIEVKLDGWRGRVTTSLGDKNVIKVSVNTWKPEASKAPAKPAAKQNDNEDDFPF